MKNKRLEFPREWERITNLTYRLKVPKGWIVSLRHTNKIIFVSDVLHDWQLTKGK